MCMSIWKFQSNKSKSSIFHMWSCGSFYFFLNIYLLFKFWLLFPIPLTKLWFTAQTNDSIDQDVLHYLNKLNKLNMSASFSHSDYCMCWWKYLNVSNHLHYHFDWTGEESTGKNEPNTLVDRNHECLAGCCKCYIPWLRVQNLVFILVSDPLFDLFITFCILINTIFMGIEYHNMPQGLVDATTWANFVCRKLRNC